MRLIAAAALTLIFAAPAFAAGEVYKWKDDAGVVHYTDTPPDGRDYETVKGATRTPAPAPATDADAAAAAAPTDGSAPAPAPAPAAAPVGSPQANCDSARRNVDNLTRFENINMDRDGDGTAETLTPEQKAEELTRNQALVDLYCPRPDGTGP